MLWSRRDPRQPLRPLEHQAPKMCVFEYVYFARPDSYIGGRSVYEVRKALGETLAKEHVRFIGSRTTGIVVDLWTDFRLPSSGRSTPT